MIVYMAIFDGYDYPPPRPLDKSRHVLFTDKPTHAAGWEVFVVSRQFANPARENRYYKLQPHILFPDQVTMYLDGNSLLRQSPTEIASLFMDSSPAAQVHTFASQINATLSSELAWIQSHGIVDHDLLSRQMARYADLPDLPTAECRLLLSQPGCGAFYDTWWSEVKNYGHRDQLSLIYAETSTGTVVHRWPGDRRQIMKVRAHRKPQLVGAV